MHDKAPKVRVVRNLDEEGVLTPEEQALQAAVAEKPLKGIEKLRRDMDELGYRGVTFADNPMVFPRHYTDHLRVAPDTDKGDSEDR